MARWLFDYRNGLTIIGTGLLVLLTVTVGDSIQSRNRAFDALKLANKQQSDARAAATRRIDLLQQQIAALQSSAEQNGGRISQLLSEVAALQEQVRQMGGRPVVTETATTASGGARTAPATTVTTRPGGGGGGGSPPTSPSTTTTTRPSAPSTTTSTTTCVTVLVLHACR